MNIEEFLTTPDSKSSPYVIPCCTMIAALSEEKQRVVYFFLCALSKSKS